MIFLDNVDQRDSDIQQKAFLIAQEIATHWTATVFLTMRPQTFNRSKKLGALSGYNLKAFSIAPPRVDEVLVKRLGYGKKIASGQIDTPVLTRGISLQLESIRVFIDVLLWNIKENIEIIQFVDNVSNGNIRLALDFVKTFIGSAHIDAEKILRFEQDYKKEDDSRHYKVKLHQLLRTIMYLDGEYYDPVKSPIANLFDLSSPDGREHFILPILIGFIGHASSDISTHGFVEVGHCNEYLQSLGYSISQIDFAVKRGIIKNLIETEARKMPEIDLDPPKLLRSTPVGFYHIGKLIKEFTYVDSMILDTPILDESYRSKIYNASSFTDRLRRSLIFSEYLSGQWSKVPSVQLYFSWPDNLKELKARIDYIKSKIDPTPLF